MKTTNKRNKNLSRRTSKTGLPPGTPVYTGKKHSEKIDIDVFTYSSTDYHRFSPDTEQLLKMVDVEKKWINITGLNDVDAIRSICDKFGIHYLYQEDILNIDQRPKVEEEDEYLFICFKSLTWVDEIKTIEEEQISLILTQDTVISFQESPGDNFDPIREKLMAPSSIIKERNIDYLFYRLMDITVDGYYDIMDNVGKYIDELEDEVIDEPVRQTLIKVQNNKKDLMILRKNIYPLRDVINKLTYNENTLIDVKTRKYFRDVLDHTTQNIENIETFREVNMSLKDIYLNTQSNEINKIMKVLTIISTIFIPLTFIAGVYGMNFENMPELQTQYGYFIVLGVMVIIGILLAYWFKRKSWI